MISKSTITFLKDLKDNNNRDWFLLKNKEYQKAKQEVIDLVKAVTENLSKKSKAYAEIDASKCLFRINRDVRFSSNKDPYKTNMGAIINVHGKKSLKAGLYIHIEPQKSFLAGGVYMPPNDVLAKIRQEIDYNFEDFKKIINAKNFKQQFIDIDKSESLKNPPKGFDKDNEAITYIKLKSYIAVTEFSDKEITAENFANLISEKCLVLFPFLEFINNAID